MTNNQSDELLREILGELGQLRKLLDERLPQPAKIEPRERGSSSGATQAVVTGEGSTPSPVARSAAKVTQKRR